MRLLLLLAAGVAFAALAGCAERDHGDARVIDVEISRYTYAPGSELAIEVERGERVVLRLTSTDVTHGFAIVEYGIHEEIPPGQTIEVSFVADKPGAFTIFCTVFCGSGHPEHKGTLYVA